MPSAQRCATLVSDIVTAATISGNYSMGNNPDIYIYAMDYTFLSGEEKKPLLIIIKYYSRDYRA